MKSKLTIALVVLAYVSVLLSQCTHDDQEIPDVTTPIVNANDLNSAFTTAPPSIDGAIDAAWDNATAIQVVAEVPDPGDDVFKGYVGDSYTVELKSLYDASNIYFLAVWDDRTFSFNRQTWYFDLADKLWHQESRVPTFNDTGNQIRQPFYEDKFGVLWNIDNSVDNFSCFSSCHTGLNAADGYARHYTSTPFETIDMWHWKGVRTDINNQADDQYQNNDTPNGRKSDTKDQGGYTNNTKDLTITGTATQVTVPKYFIPDEEYYYFITQAQIDAGTAKEITAVDANGVLTYDGGTIDPNTELRFQREGSTTGAFGIPSVYTEPFVGSRGDITAKGVYTGSGWVLELKRALDTGDAEAQDIDFSDLSDQPFGIGVFDNAGIAHAIKSGLTLKFEK